MRTGDGIMRILIVKLSALGDVIVAARALAGLRQVWPELEVDWAIDRRYEPVLRETGLVDRLLGLDADRRWRSLRLLRRERYDLVIDLQGLAKSALVCRLARRGRVLGFAAAREGARRFYHDALGFDDPEMESEQRYRALLEHALGVSIPERLPRLEYAGEGFDRGRMMLAQFAHPVALGIRGRWESKQWPAEHFAELGRWLLEQGCTPVVIGGPADADLGTQILQDCGAGINLCGHSGLDELPGLLRECRAYVGVDTGPMHLADAVGTPVVAVFGPTSIRRTGPVDNRHNSLASAFRCAPCFRRQCPVGGRCLHHVFPEQLIERLQVLGIGAAACSAQR